MHTVQSLTIPLQKRKMRIRTIIFLTIIVLMKTTVKARSRHIGRDWYSDKFATERVNKKRPWMIYDDIKASNMHGNHLLVCYLHDRFMYQRYEYSSRKKVLITSSNLKLFGFYQINMTTCHICRYVSHHAASEMSSLHS